MFSNIIAKGTKTRSKNRDSTVSCVVKKAIQLSCEKNACRKMFFLFLQHQLLLSLLQEVSKTGAGAG